MGISEGIEVCTVGVCEGSIEVALTDAVRPSSFRLSGRALSDVANVEDRVHSRCTTSSKTSVTLIFIRSSFVYESEISNSFSFRVH